MNLSLLGNKLAARAFAVETELAARRSRRAFGRLYDPEYVRAESERLGSQPGDPLLELGCQLRDELLARYRDRYAGQGLRAVLHIPPNGAGLYSYPSWAATLNYMGVEARTLAWWDKGWRDLFDTFRPNLFLTADREVCLTQFDWEYLRHLKQEAGLVVCLMAARDYDDDVIYRQHLDQAVRGLTADLYYFVGIPEFNREFLRDYFDAGFEVLSLPWAANPLNHYRVPGEPRLDYFFVGTNDAYKVQEAKQHLRPLIRRHRGIILGAGFGSSIPLLDQEYIRYYCNLCKVAVNYHEPGQVRNNVNVNERTLVIPACGGFQLVDRPRALSYFFDDDEIASAAGGPADYYEQFVHYLAHPEERQALTAKSMRRVYAEHTTFHRMEALLQAVLKFGERPQACAVQETQ